MIEVTEIREKFDELSRPTLESGRFLELATFTQHGTTTTLDHVVAVAYASLFVALSSDAHVNEHDLVRGALLHDYYLYDWHDHSAAPDKWHGFTHPRHALNNALIDFPDLSPIERDIILHTCFLWYLSHRAVKKRGLSLYATSSAHRLKPVWATLT